MMRDAMDLIGFDKLPFAARTGILLGIGAVGVGTLYFLRAALPWLIAGVVVILLLIIAFEVYRRYKAKKEGQTFSESLKSMLRLQPRTASAEERSRLEQMREKFEEGVEKFRSAGRSVYDVPWFILIGEPGSGKTEAIRRSNIAFPPGLQDRFQGAGGTVNMDWWFTNDAVIIDTAGRIIVEEVSAGQVAEWDQLLTMLKTQRKKCPINGVVLMLPAAAPPVEPGQQPATGGLLDDTPEQIEQRATRFVERLSRLQQRLGVRFPVFVVVTMCDRVLGFREFFDNITDVAQQHQMLGWSNPAPLDEPYNSQSVESALGQVSDRLRQRRLELLRDPVHSEDAQKPRADQVDKLYAFPEAFDSLAPNLRAYLDRLFTKTSWYQPPFFRGVFFASSMQKGAAIDNALADLVGADADAVSEGGVFRADRAYFLKDVIEKKVFEEKGLVTDAADAEGARRKARTVMWVAGGAAAALLLASMGWGVLCAWNWQKANLEPWRNARNAYHYPEDQGGEFIPDRAALIVPIVDADAAPSYNPMPGGDDAYGGSSLEIQRRLLNRLDTAESGFMCRLFGSSFDADTSMAQATLLARVLTRPAAAAALRQLAGDAEADNPAGAGPEGEARALAELLRWATISLGGRPAAALDAAPAPGESAGVDFTPLAGVVRVQEETAEAWRGDAPGFADVFRQTASRLSREDPGALREWLAFSLRLSDADLAGERSLRAQLTRAVDRVADRLESPAADASAFGAMVTLEDAVGRFLEAERALWTMSSQQTAGLDMEEALRQRTLWLRSYDELRAQRDRVERALPALRDAAGASGLTPEFVERVVERRRESMEASFERMLGALPPAPDAEAAPPDPQTDAGWLEAMRLRVAQRRTAFGEAFDARAEELRAGAQAWLAHVRSLDADGAHALGRRFETYRLAQERFTDEDLAPGAVRLDTLAEAIRRVGQDAAARLTRSDETLAPVLTAESSELRDSASSSKGALQWALNLAAALHRQEAVVEAMASGWPSSERIVETFSDADRALPVPSLSPLNPEGGEVTLRPEFSIEAGRALAGAYAMALAGVADTGSAGAEGALLNPDAARAPLEEIRPSAQDWLAEYASYWSDTLAGATGVQSTPTWRAFREQSLNLVRPFDAKREIQRIRDAVAQAVAPLRAIPEPERGAAATRLSARVDDGRGAESAILDDYALDTQLGFVIDYLRALPADAVQARDRLLRDMRAGQVEPFPFLKNAQRNLGEREYLFETRYTIQLLTAAASAVRSETYNALAGRYDEFASGRRGQFPFADPPAEAGVEQWRAVPTADPEALGDFGGVDSLVTGADEAGVDNMASYPVALREVAAALTDLLGPEERRRAERLLALRTALQSPQAGGSGVDLTCHIVLLGERNLDRPTNVNVLRVGDNRAQAFSVDDAPYTDDRLNKPFSFNAAQAIELELLNTEFDERPLLEADLGDWSPLKMLYAFDARPADAPQGSPAKEWDIRVPVAGGEVHLRLVFERPLPPLDQWPRF